MLVVDCTCRLICYVGLLVRLTVDCNLYAVLVRYGKCKKMCILEERKLIRWQDGQYLFDDTKDN